MAPHLITAPPPAQAGAVWPSSVGIGLRRELMPAIAQSASGQIDFLECTPDNWIGIGGKLAKDLEQLSTRFPLTCHGLSLSIGGPGPLDIDFLRKTRQFLDRFQVHLYSEHLSYCTDQGHLYELLPMPFTSQAVTHLVGRIGQVQDILQRRIALENVSYYAAPYREMDEAEFIIQVLDKSGCDILLDVNNVAVNATNHGYDALEFISRMPSERVAYYHVAGHHQAAPDLRIDTHAAPVSQEVFDLLAHAYVRHGLRPTLLERDDQFPHMGALTEEIEHIRTLQSPAGPSRAAC